MIIGVLHIEMDGMFFKVLGDWLEWLGLCHDFGQCNHRRELGKLVYIKGDIHPGVSGLTR